MDPNPYEAPATPLANPGEPAVSADRRSWWVLLRWEPLAFCAYLTAACLLIGAVQVSMLIQLLASGQQSIIPAGSQPWVVGVTFPLGFGLMALGLRAVQHWYRCRWRWACLSTLILCVLMTLGVEALDHFAPIRSIPKVAPPRNRVQP